MSKELMAINNQISAVAEPKGRNYLITAPLTGAEVKIERDIDFGVIPGTKRPSLFKSGAEKIVGAYQLMPRYSIESKIEQYDQKNAFFMYVVKCSLVKGFMDAEGHYAETEYASAYGSANTGEKRNGFNDACNSANSTLKMAMKRSLVSCALSISSLSSMFTCDIEDETVTKKATEFINESPEAAITKAQINRIFSYAGQYGLTREECKQKLASMGYAKTSDIKQKDYNAIIEALKNIDDKEQKNGN